MRKKAKDFILSDKLSICCREKMKLDYPSSDIGVCTKCGKLAMDKSKQDRLWKNKNQSFKKIADDAIYNVTWNKKRNNYRYVSNSTRNTK
mgnify:FL=1